MKPSVGRIVHYNDIVAKCQAAIVTDTADTIVNLAVFRHGGSVGSDMSVPFSAEPYDRTKPQTSWHFPERVEE